jgi:hypothetical protein
VPIGTMDENAMRRIIREEAKAAATEAVQEFVVKRARDVAPLFNVKPANDPVLDIAHSVSGLLRPKAQAVGELTCSFCGMHQKQRKKMVSGPAGLHICDDCIEKAHNAATKR